MNHAESSRLLTPESCFQRREKMSIETFIDVLLIVDIVLLALAGVLFLISRRLSDPAARRTSTAAKILIGLALLGYLAAEFGIGHGDNLFWGILMVLILVVAMMLINRHLSRS